MTRLRGALIAAAVPLSLLSACAQPVGNDAAAAPGPAESSTAAPLPGADDLVLRAEAYGGFVPADLVVGRLPMVSVYGDGRVIAEGPVPAIYPPPALPNLQVQMVTPEVVRELVRQGLAAGVKNGTDYGRPGVADAPTTRVTVISDGVTQSVAAEALGEAQSTDPNLTEAQRAARTKLSAYVKKLTGLSSAPGMSRPVTYQPETVAVLARPWADNGSGEPAPATKAWTGPKLPGGYLNPDIKIGCVVVTGAQKDAVLADAKTASHITPWTAGYDKWLITFRPLLPDEAKGCAVLSSGRS
jgi:hypothetical protein